LFVVSILHAYAKLAGAVAQEVCTSCHAVDCCAGNVHECLRDPMRGPRGADAQVGVVLGVRSDKDGCMRRHGLMGIDAYRPRIQLIRIYLTPSDAELAQEVPSAGVINHP
jgi:hypothetical protein